jgi:predicted Zn-dependent protease
VTVRQKIDQLEAEPPVRDLGYAADQRLVATALLGLQLLADEIDALKAESQNTGSRQPRPFAEPVGMRVVEDDDDDRDDEADIADIVDQLAELTAQMKKLTKAVKQSTGTKEKKPKK